MRVRLALLLVAAGVATSAPAVELARADSCGEHGRKCMRIAVPLDHSGRVPGTVALGIEYWDAPGRVPGSGPRSAPAAPRPPLFVIAGDPGESTTHTYPPQDIDLLLGSELLVRDVVVMDVRGTGRSGPLPCPSLQRSSGLDLSDAAAACAQALGPPRAYYTAADAADDVEAVRERLGIDRIVLYGVSHGADVALTYARRHPAQVDRLVLQSVAGPEGVDVFRRSSMRAARGVMRSVCGRRCRGFTSNPARDLERLVTRLEQGPISGYLTGPDGRRRRAGVDSAGLLRLLVADGVHDEQWHASIPGAVRGALQGDPAQLLRIQAGTQALRAPSSPLREMSAGARAAALCEAATLPWSDATTPAERRGRATAFATALPSDAFGPFSSRTALSSDLLELCEGWPSSPRAADAPAGGLPNVPMLVIVGALDVQTPVEDARAVAALLPRSRLMVVRNAGHDIDADGSLCLEWVFTRFLAGEEPGACLSELPGAFPAPPPPRGLGELRPAGGLTGRPGRTLRAVRMTLGDLVTSTFAAGPGSSRDPRPRRRSVLKVGALRGGSYALVGREEPFELGWRLKRASFVPGVRVTGAVRLKGLNFDGELAVSGPAAARGRLVLRHGILVGRLGGRKVTWRLYEDIGR